MPSLARPFSMIRSGSGAALTPSAQPLQARFSRLVTATKYCAGSRSSCSLCSYPITTVSLPQDLHTRCCGVHGMTCSTRGRLAGNSCRPGCLPLFRWFLADTGDEGGRGSRPASASTSAALTPGSRSSNCSCALLSFSLLGPYLRILSSRIHSSRDWIFIRAHVSSCVRFTICSASERGGVESVGFTIRTTARIPLSRSS